MSGQKVALLVAAGCCISNPASAHAPPQATGIQWLPSDAGERALVRTNRGLIVEALEGGSFDIVCNDAFQASLSEVPPVVTEPQGRLLLGTYAMGLVSSSPDLCGYEPVAGAFEGYYPIALTTDAEGVVYAAALPYDGSTAALLRSSDHGRTAASLSDLPGAPTAIQVAPSDPSRLYVSVTTAEDNLSFGSLLTSEDAGLNFDQHPVELDPSELRVFLLAVAPEEPQLLFIRTQSRDGLTPERLLRSEDGGRTFDAVLSVPGPLSAVVGADGVVWAGAADGLYRSEDQGRSFALAEGASVTRIGCLAKHGSALYACGYSAGEFGVQVSRDGDGTFEWFLRFPQVTARLDCPTESDEGQMCGAAFADWVEEQSVAPGTASGEAGAPTSPAAPEPTRPSRNDPDLGCQFPSAAPATRSAVWLGALLAMTWRRVRGRRSANALSGGR